MADPCLQTETIKKLEITQARLSDNYDKVMEILTEVRDDVKDMKKYLFEWWMKNDYVSKEEFNLTIQLFKDKLAEKEKEIADLKKNQNKVAWVIISAVLIALVWLVIVPKAF